MPVATVKATKKKQDPAVSVPHDVFVKACIQAKFVTEEAAKITSMTIYGVRSRAQRLRKIGVNLPQLISARSIVNVDELNRMLAESAAAPPAAPKGDEPLFGSGTFQEVTTTPLANLNP